MDVRPPGLALLVVSWPVTSGGRRLLGGRGGGALGAGVGSVGVARGAGSLGPLVVWTTSLPLGPLKTTFKYPPN